MNYGYRSADLPAPSLDPADEPDRSCVQLYDVVARAAPIAGRELLEVGCGRGGGAAYLARALEPSRMVAVDLSPRAIALLPDVDSRRPNLSFQVGDAETAAVPRRLVRRRAERRVVALLRAVRRFPGRGAPGVAARRASSSTPTSDRPSHRRLASRPGVSGLRDRG